jgi:hypothetical protein
MDKNKIHVLKRDGTREVVTPERIKERLQGLMENLNTTYVNLDIVCAKVCKGIYDGVTTEILDNLSAETCAYMSIVHPDYSKLAARIVISNLHKKTETSFLKTAEKLYTYKDKAGKFKFPTKFFIFSIVFTYFTYLLIFS